MSFCTLLSRDSISSILQYVDFDSLVRLFATFDLRLQKTMSSAGALPHLSIAPNSSLPRAPIKYFLNHVNSPRHIEFAPDVKWSAMTLPLLAALAPRSLTLHNGFLHQSVHQMIQDHHVQTESLKTVVKFVHPDGLVNFSSLLPTLESLDIINDIYFMPSIWKEGLTLLGRFVSTLPNTLTHLSLHKAFQATDPSQWIPQLPQSLTSLRLTWSHPIALSTIFDRLPLIETLNLNAAHILNYSISTNEVLKIPSSLHELVLTTNGALPEIVLGGTSLIHSNIKSFALVANYATETIDLRSVLPPGLQSLTIGGRLISDGILPRSLTSPEERLDVQPSCFNSVLKKLSALKSLKIIAEGVLSPSWNSSKLDLPSGFQYLSAPLQLSQIIAILDQCPSCVIVSLIDLDLRSLGVVNAIQSNPALLACTESVFDGPRLNAAIEAMLKHRVTFRPIQGIHEERAINFSWPSTKVILAHDTFCHVPYLADLFPHANELSVSTYTRFTICLRS